jgi:hypothetical protein
VNQASASKEEARRPLGTLACVTTGFEVTARNPELILLPLLLDMFLWLGPRLSLAPILRSIKAFLQSWLIVDAVSSEVAEAYSLVSRILTELSEGFNLFSVMNPAPLIGVPVLMPIRVSAMRPFGAQPALEIASVPLMTLVSGGLALVGVGFGALYLRAIGRSVLAETQAPLPGPNPVWGLWAQFVKLGVALLVGMVSFSVVISFLVTFLGFLSYAVAGLAMTLATSAVLFIMLHLLFTIPGVLQLRRGLLQAMRESLLLTRGDFLNVVFLLLLIFVISQGLNVVWTLPEPNSWANAIGLAGHAFVSTALTAGLLVFYQERLRFLDVLKHLYAAVAQEATAHPIIGD